MAKTYRAALIGCGRMGATIDDEMREHPQNIMWLPHSHAAGLAAHGRTELVAVSDAVPEKAEEIRKRYDVPRAYTDYREMLETERPEIVSVATRPGPRAEIVIWAAEHGARAIYCEKPLCCSMREADAVREACERKGVKFNYGTQRRYAPAYRKIRELVDNGAVGDVNGIIGHCGASGAQWGLTHATDMLLYLAGDGEVEFAQGSIRAAEGDWEGMRLNIDPPILSAYFQFKNGIHAYLVAAGGWEFEVSGPKGKLRSLNDGFTCQSRQVGGSHKLLEETTFPEYQHHSGTLNAIQDLVEALDTGADTVGNIRVTHRSQEMILAVIESSRQGGARVPLPMANRDLYVANKAW